MVTLTGQLQTVQHVHSANKSRHQELEDIERKVQDVAELFQEVFDIVTGSEPKIREIEERTEEVAKNAVEGKARLEGAVDKARKARRKKYMLSGIMIAIVLILALILTIVFVLKLHHKA